MLARMMSAQTHRTTSQPESQEDDYVDIEKGYYVCHDIKNSSLTRRITRPSSFRRSRPQGSNWMSFVDGETLISALSIPGTHDSAAYRRSWPFVQTQDMTIEEQLNAGIRYFDLRCGVRSDIVEMVHGISLLGITLDDILQSMYDWLAITPTEALIVQIKEDRNPESSSLPFAQAISNCLARRPECWRTDETTPSLDDLRGRIQLLRRYDAVDADAYGIDVTPWVDNPIEPFTINTQKQVRLTIQDHYSFPGPESLQSLIFKKGTDVLDMLEKTISEPDPSHWFLNFTSTYEFNFYHQITPWQVAAGGYWNFRWQDGMNVLVSTAIGTGHIEQRLGIVIMDFPDKGVDGLIDSVFLSNFGHRRKRSERMRILALLLIIVLLAVLSVIGLPSYRPSVCINWRRI